MKKLTAFVMILALTSFAWAEGASSSRGTKALNPQPLPSGKKGVASKSKGKAKSKKGSSDTSTPTPK